MSFDSAHPLYVAAVIERADNQVLIVLPSEGDSLRRHWAFPRGLADPKEPPEAAMRRVASQSLGIKLEIIVGQPPITARVAGQEVHLRYFFCGIISGEPCSESFAEVRWIHKAHLREYEFDAASVPVTNWLLER